MGPKNKTIVKPRGRTVAASKPVLLIPITSAKLCEDKSCKMIDNLYYVDNDKG